MTPHVTRKRVDCLVAPSRSMRKLVTLRDLDGGMFALQEALTAAGFDVGEKVSIVPTRTMTADRAGMERLAARLAELDPTTYERCPRCAGLVSVRVYVEHIDKCGTAQINIVKGVDGDEFYTESGNG